jgi:transcriptional regulator with XRE-family HTH domain
MHGNRIAELRQEAGVSQAEIAAEHGVKEVTVDRWEKEKTAVPDDHKRKLSARFGCSIEHLMGWDRQSPSGQKVAA